MRAIAPTTSATIHCCSVASTNGDDAGACELAWDAGAAGGAGRTASAKPPMAPAVSSRMSTSTDRLMGFQSLERGFWVLNRYSAPSAADLNCTGLRAEALASGVERR